MRKVTCEEFEDEIARSTVPVVVLFTNEWCGSAFIVKGALEEIEKSYPDRFNFIEVDEAECEEIASRYGIVNIPQIMVFHESVIVEQIKGVPYKKTIEDKLNTVPIS